MTTSQRVGKVRPVVTHSTVDEAGATNRRHDDYLRTILRQFSDLRQSYDNWRIPRTFATIL